MTAPKAERGKLFNWGQAQTIKSRKSDHCSFSRYKVLLFDHLLELMGDDLGRLAWREYPLRDLGVDYDVDLSVEETARKIAATVEPPKAVVVNTKN